MNTIELPILPIYKDNTIQILKDLVIFLKQEKEYILDTGIPSPYQTEIMAIEKHANNEGFYTFNNCVSPWSEYFLCGKTDNILCLYQEGFVNILEKVGLHASYNYQNTINISYMWIDPEYFTIDNENIDMEYYLQELIDTRINEIENIIATL